MKVIFLIIILALLVIFLLNIPKVEHFASISIPKKESQGFKEFNEGNQLTCNGSKKPELYALTENDCLNEIQNKFNEQPNKYLFGSFISLDDNNGYCLYGNGDTMDEAKTCDGNGTISWWGCREKAKCFNIEIEPKREPATLTATYPEKMKRGLYLLDIIVSDQNGAVDLFDIDVENPKQYISGDLKDMIKSVSIAPGAVKLYLKDEFYKYKPDDLIGKEFIVIFGKELVKTKITDSEYTVNVVYHSKSCNQKTPGDDIGKLMQCPKYAEDGKLYNLTGCLLRNDGVNGVYRFENPAAKQLDYWKISQNTTTWDNTCAKVPKDKCGNFENPKCAYYDINESKMFV